MVFKQHAPQRVTLEKIIGGGQALGTLASGKKAFVWNGLPGEDVTFQPNKQKSNFVEGIVTEVHSVSSSRIDPLDPESYLSTSPWQIMTFEAEQHYKAALIEEAFELHDIVLPNPISVRSDNKTERYRNKVEFSWYGSEDETTGKQYLDLAFFRRGSKGKIIVHDSSLLPESIVKLATEIRDLLAKKHVSARQLKTLLIRSDQQGNCVWQLYVKDLEFNYITENAANAFSAQGGEVIHSDPRSPASRITKRLHAFGDIVLTDMIKDVTFRYATESFFQVNIPLYELALSAMEEWVLPSKPVVDLYSGVGTIGLTIGGDDVTLIEINEDAVREMRENISRMNRSSSAKAVLAPSEKALEHISSDACIIVDPPRAGLHSDVITALLDNAPERIIYLSCNPVTQARDVALLAEKYGVRAHEGFNFFPRTPHIEHLVVLDKK
jgi:23S rRNA (uracil1939-C5)-methyltransferase